MDTGPGLCTDMTRLCKVVPGEADGTGPATWAVGGLMTYLPCDEHNVLSSRLTSSGLSFLMQYLPDFGGRSQ
jgi:hypothetical protein